MTNTPSRHRAFNLGRPRKSDFPPALYRWTRNALDMDQFFVEVRSPRKVRKLWYEFRRHTGLGNELSVIIQDGGLLFTRKKEAN